MPADRAADVDHQTAAPGAAAWLVLLLAMALRLYRLPAQSMWWDEGHSLFVAGHSLAAIPTVPAMDVHPPLYFWLLHLWLGVAGQSEFALRFLSLTFGLLTVAVMYRLGRRWLGSTGGLLAGLLAATSPLYLAYSQEVRMYSLVTLFCALSLYFFAEAMEPGRTARPGAESSRLRSSSLLKQAQPEEPASAGLSSVAWEFTPRPSPGHSPAVAPLALYTLFTALGLYTHYFVGFLLIAENVFWLGATVISGRWRRPSEWARWIAAQVGIVVLLAPQIVTAARQVSAYENSNLTPPAPAQFVVETWRAFTLGIAADGTWARAGMWIFVAVLALGLLARVLSRSARDLPASRGLLLAAGFVLPLAAYYAVLLRRASFSPRYMIVATPALYVALAYAAFRLGRRWAPLGAVAALALVGVFGVCDYAYYFDPAFAKDDTRGLSRFLEQTAGPRDVVFIDVPYPLDYYYHGVAPASYLFVDVHTIADVLTKACLGRERLFFARWRQSDTDPRGAVTFLLDKYGARRGEKRFRGYDVVWYDLPSPAAFDLPATLNPTEVDFDGAVTLTGLAFGGRGQGDTPPPAEAKAASVPAGRPAWVTLGWTIPRSAGADYKAALYLRDARGHLIAQTDRDLLNDRHLHTAAWKPGETALNVYTLPVPPGTPPGDYAIQATVYRADGGGTLDVLDEAGAPQGVAATLGTIRVVRPLTPPDPAAMPIANRLDRPLGDDLLLLGDDGSAWTAETGGVLSLSLFWQARRDVRADARVRLALFDADGTLAAESTGSPAGGSYPTAGWLQDEIVQDRVDFPVPAALPAGQYELRVGVAPAGTTAPVAETALGQVEVKGRAHRFDTPPIAHPGQARFGAGIEWLGYDLAPTDRTVHVTLYWRAGAPMSTSYKVFTHLLGADGKIVGQKDDFPGAGAWPTTGWVEGEVLADTYEIAVDPGAPAGDCTLEFGWYDPATGARLPVVDAAGQAVADHVVVPAN